VPSKWEVNDAIQASRMAPNARLVMFVLISPADPETAEIPERFTPSLDDLVRRTGLSKSAVAEWLTVLEESGWVKRDRPTTAESLGFSRRTRYQLTIGDMEGTPKPQRTRQTRAKVTHGNEDSTGSGVRVADSPRGGQSTLPEGPRGGQSGVRVADSDCPRGGHKSSSSYQVHLPPTGGTAAAVPHQEDALFDAPPKAETPDFGANVVLAQWIDHCTAHDITLTKAIKGRYAAKIAEILRQGIKPELLRDALIRMRERGFAGSPSKLDEFLTDVQNQRSTKPARTAGDSRSVSSAEAINQWTKKGAK
jgi:hypothetical protein